MKRYKSGFSLIEIMVGILIVSIIMIAAFQALASVGIAKVKLIERAEIEKQAYFASEKFFELVKKGGSIDYEEYWNRYSYDQDFASGAFLNNSGFGNFGRGGNPGTPSYGSLIYHCVSNASGTPGGMGTGGCLEDNNINYILNGLNVDRTGQPQRYTQYELQFIDRNSDGDIDDESGVSIPGDEDGDGDIIGDDDDLFLGIGPAAFSGSTSVNKVGELYLINNTGTERTYFRWRVETASGSFVPTGATCDYTDRENPQGDACHGTIEILKLQGKDYGYNHVFGSIDANGSESDGIIDTWIIHPDFNPNASEVVAGSNTTNYWQAIFPDSVSISDFELYVYPKKDINYSWRDNDPSILSSPYIQLKYTISPSLEVQARITGEKPSVDVATTIQLSSLDIR